MKLAFRTTSDGGRTAIALTWEKNAYFAGDPPEVDRLVVLAPPDLRGDSVLALRAWLAARSTAQGAGQAAPLDLVPEGAWRYGTLDDLLDAAPFDAAELDLEACVPLSELAEFAARRVPEATARAREACAAVDPAARLERLAALAPFLSRVFAILDAFPRRAEREREQLSADLDRSLLAAVRAGAPGLAEWVDAALRMRSEAGLSEVFAAIAPTLADPRTTQADLFRALGALAAHQPTRRHLDVTYTEVDRFWKVIARRLRLAPNVRGETLDLTDAAEQQPGLDFGLIVARRVGNVIPDRRALALTAPDGTVTFVRGTRALLHAVARAGGRLEGMGNTLVVRTEARRSVHRGLLEVERIDTLANVAPRQLLPEIEQLAPSTQAAARRLVEESPGDPRRARRLADLLIEATVGVDADVARRLSRQRRRGSRAP